MILEALFGAVTFFRMILFARGFFSLIDLVLKLLKTPKNMFQLHLSAELARWKLSGPYGPLVRKGLKNDSEGQKIEPS